MYFLEHISKGSTSSTFKTVPSFQQIKCLGLSDFGSSLESLTNLPSFSSHLHQKLNIHKFICLCMFENVSYIKVRSNVKVSGGRLLTFNIQFSSPRPPRRGPPADAEEANSQADRSLGSETFEIEVSPYFFYF